MPFLWILTFFITVSCQGDPGPKGRPGQTGSVGPEGPQGETNDDDWREEIPSNPSTRPATTPVLQTNCITSWKTIEPNNSYVIEYKITKFEDNSTEATANVDFYANTVLQQQATNTAKSFADKQSFNASPISVGDFDFKLKNKTTAEAVFTPFGFTKTFGCTLKDLVANGQS
jgi:hypothetical protein